MLGAPFFVMGRVQGRVPGDSPSYHVEGWVVEETSPAEREAMWWSALEAMAAVHNVDWRALGLGELWQEERGDTGLAQQLAYSPGTVRSRWLRVIRRLRLAVLTRP